MSSANTHTDLTGRILAVLVFLIGIGLLCLVFYMAWSLFHSPVSGLALPVKPGAVAPPASSIGIALTAFVQKVVLLALMTLAGSLISSKGIHLYYSAAHGGSAHDAPAKTTRNGHAPIPVQESAAAPPTQNPLS
jgi:hypothetical protein